LLINSRRHDQFKGVSKSLWFPFQLLNDANKSITVLKMLQINNHNNSNNNINITFSPLRGRLVLKYPSLSGHKMNVSDQIHASAAFTP